MAKKMPDWMRFPLVLVIVTSVSAFCLAGLRALTLPQKRAMEAKITERALKVVMPQATSFETRQGPIDGRKFYYRVAKLGEEEIGYVAQGQATGYSSVIKVMVGVDKDFVVQGVEVLSQKETPGLGDKVDEIRSKRTWWTVLTGTSPDERGLRPWFQAQFVGLGVPVKVDKDGGRVEAITGATISSRTVCQAVNRAVDDLKTVLGSTS
jgi:electron transport complex protein RnfG